MTHRALCDYEIDCLRILNGDSPKMQIIAGAALWSTCETLRNMGYVVDSFRITDKGKQYLADLKPADPKKESN